MPRLLVGVEDDLAGRAADVPVSVIIAPARAAAFQICRTSPIAWRIIIAHVEAAGN